MPKDNGMWMPEPRRRLLITNEALGDAVMASGFIRALGADGWQVDVCGKSYLAILQASGIVHHVHVDQQAGRYSWLQSWLRRFHAADKKLRQQLASVHYNEVIVFHRDMKRGMGRGLALWFHGCVRVIPAMQIVPGEHNISGYRQAAEALEVANYFVAQPVLSVDQTRRQSMAEKIIASAGKNPIAIQLGNSLTHDGRKWYRWRPRPQPNLKALPMQTWVDVITALVRRSLASGILFQGSPQERHLAEEIIALLPTDVREQVHTWSLGLSAIDMAVALSCCRLLVSVDTGPAHIAAALGIPVVVAFGPTPYRHYYPQGSSATAVVVGKAACSPCHGTKMAKTCRSNVCMSGIKSDRLITAVEQILQTTTPGLFIY